MLWPLGYRCLILWAGRISNTLNNKHLADTIIKHPINAYLVYEWNAKSFDHPNDLQLLIRTAYDQVV